MEATTALGDSATGDLERAVLAGARGTLEDVALALEGWRPKLADQFDELLCLARTRDVRRLDHQVETVHRVLRTFCGRALFADEVGLGKTIEAGMLISEYLLRGMARNVLVVCPAALVGQWRAELNLKQYGDKEKLKRSIQALHQLVQDWQFAYSSIDAQLSLALRTNEEQNRLIASLREQLRRAQARANESERKLLDLEGERERARAGSRKTQGGPRPGAGP